MFETLAGELLACAGRPKKTARPPSDLAANKERWTSHNATALAQGEMLACVVISVNENHSYLFGEGEFISQNCAAASLVSVPGMGTCLKCRVNGAYLR